jgi:hypothetical protein
MGPPPRRGYGFGRPRTNVRVGGCCLPIPLGILIAGAFGVAGAARRRRH